MKTMAFEEFNIKLRGSEDSLSTLEMKGHKGSTMITMNHKEIEILIAELVNHRAKVQERLRFLQEQEDILRESRKKV